LLIGVAEVLRRELQRDAQISEELRADKLSLLILFEGDRSFFSALIQRSFFASGREEAYEALSELLKILDLRQARVVVDEFVTEVKVQLHNFVNQRKEALGLLFLQILDKGIGKHDLEGLALATSGDEHLQD